MSDQQELKCNDLNCRSILSTSGSACITTCSHIFCTTCANKFFSEALVCPACETTLSQPDEIVMVNLNPSQAYKSSILAGLSPSLILEIASRAISFWTYQTAQENQFQQLQQQQLKDKISTLEKNFSKVARDSGVELTGFRDQVVNLQQKLEQEKRKCVGLNEKLDLNTRELDKLRRMFENQNRKPIFLDRGPNRNTATDNTNSGNMTNNMIVDQGAGVGAGFVLRRARLMNEQLQDVTLDLNNPASSVGHEIVSGPQEQQQYIPNIYSRQIVPSSTIYLEPTYNYPSVSSGMPTLYHSNDNGHISTADGTTPNISPDFTRQLQYQQQQQECQRSHSYDSTRENFMMMAPLQRRTGSEGGAGLTQRGLGGAYDYPPLSTATIPLPAVPSPGQRRASFGPALSSGIHMDHSRQSTSASAPSSLASTSQYYVVSAGAGGEQESIGTRMSQMGLGIRISGTGGAESRGLNTEKEAMTGSASGVEVGVNRQLSRLESSRDPAEIGGKSRNWRMDSFYGYR